MARPGSTTEKVAPKTRALISLILGPVLALSAAVVVPVVAAAPAHATPGDFECGNNYVYGTYYAAAGSTTTLYKIDAGTGATVATVGTFPVNVSVNALAISRDGDAAYAISTPASGAGGATLYKYGTGAVKTLSGLTANVGIPAGGYNPFLNDYWFATVDNSSTGKVSLYRVDLDSAATTVAFSTPTLTYTDTNLVGASVGTDLTFDGQGRLYLVLSTNTTTFTNKVITFSPSQLAAGGAQTGTKLVDLDAGNATTTFPGVAFGSAGYLYTEGGTTLYESNPTNGAQVSTHTTALAFSDLGSCANPTIVSAVRKNVVSRAKAGDQFMLSLSGTGFDTPLTATAATPATGIQNEQVASAVILPKTSYAIGETAAAGANLNDYISTWQCVDDDTDAVVGSGTGPNGSFTAPDTRATGKGVPIVCTITNEAKNAAITITKDSSSAPTKAGQAITYSFRVTNTGNRPLTGVKVTDTKLSGPITCGTTTLQPGDSTTCTGADYTVLQSDVETGSVANTATVKATPPTGEGAADSVTSTGSKTVTITRVPQLKIVKTLLSGNPFTVGDQLTYGFTVTNTGNVQATGVSVNDSLLSGESCTPTTLAPGASASCTASPYTVTSADVTAGKVVNTATPLGTTVAGAATTDPSSTTKVTTPIGTLPVATPNTASTKQNVPVSLNPLTAQTPDSAGVSGGGTVGTLDPTSVKLTGTGAAADRKSLTNADGTYVVDPTTGVVTFTPALNFTGTAASIGYQVTDSFGLVASSTIAIAVDAIVPTAVNDASSTAYLTPKTVTVLGNDTAGDPSVPLVAGSVKLKQSDGSYASSLTVPGQGTYTVNTPTGDITFTPASGFTGVASAVTYQVADTNGTLTTAKLTMTVANPPAPSATDDAKSGLQGHAVTVTPAANDSAGGNATLQPSSVTITTAGTTGGLGKELVVPGKGTWTVAGDGTVTFAPLPAFTGVVSLDYSIADELGQTATAKITVTIDPLQPTAAPDAAHAPYGTASLTKDVLANDIPGDAVAAPIVPGSVVLKQPDGTWDTSLAVPGEGTYLVNSSGDVTFTPAAGFSGAATAVTYRVADANGTTATSTVTMTIGNPPVATDNGTTTPQNVPVTFAVAADDTAGDDGAGVPGTIVAASVVFTDPTATDGGRTLSLAGKGTFTINSATGDVTFTPLPAYTGTTPDVGYRVTDSFGSTATAVLKVTVNPVTPIARADANHAPFGTASVTTDVLGNDLAGGPSDALVPSSVTFPDGTRSLTNADGTYTIDPVTGAIAFAPVAGFSGDAAAVTYRVSDTNGTLASAKLTVTVGKPPLAAPDTDSTPQNVTVTVAVLGNDKAGYDGSVAGGTGVQGTLTASSVTFTSASAGPDGRTLTTSEGIWTIDGATGAVTFDPDPAFTGTTRPVAYAVTDSYGNTTASTVTITVTAINPTATDDANHTPYETPVKTDVVGNDRAGAVSAPLDRSSVKITTPGPGLSADGKTLVVAGEGTWKVDGNGDITFSPAAGFSGPASIAYQVSDANGTTVTADLTVTVGVPPSADDESGTTKQNENITLDLLTGDLPGDDGAHTSGTWVASSLVFASNGATSLTVPGQGTYTIDQASGKVTLDPIPTFTGKADTVAYRVTDSFGNTATANIDITVDPVTPVAHDDAKTTPYRTPTTLDVLGNDASGAVSAPLDATSVKITTAGADADGKGLDTAQGTWTVDPVTGAITFAPKSGFTGDAVITYRVADANGTVTSATVTVTVPAPAAPSVVADTDHTPYLTPVKTTVLANDTAGGLAKLVTSSVTFTDGTKSLTDADGTYSVDAAGDITFAPAAGFSGVATAVAYRVSDELGQTGSAMLTVTVGAAPKATDNQTTTPQGVAVTIPELGDDTAGTDGAGGSGTLHKTSVVFTSATATLGGKKLVVANEGTWTIDGTTGAATFTPLPSFTGTTTQVDYQVTDSFGNNAHAGLKVVVDGLNPTAGDDTNHGEFGATVTTNVLGNDHGAAVSAPLDPTSVTIVGAPGDGRKLDVPGQGTWTVSPTTGAITFTPEAGFHGTPDPITYQVLDSNGTPATATSTVTIGNPPAATDDGAHTPFRTRVTLTPLGNDSAGDDGAGVKVPLDPADLVFTSASATLGGTKLVTAEGTWTIDATTGVVTFVPLSTFSGPTASVAYEVTDSYGHTASAFLTVTVGAPPAASDDSATTAQNVTVTLITPLANDAAGNDGAGTAGTLVPASVVFTSSAASPDGKSLTTAEGVWTIDATTGEPTFDPNPDFVGTTKPVGYEVTDSFGNVATAHWTVTVTGISPVAGDDSNHGPYGSAVTTPVLGNDSAGAPTAPLDAASVVITSAGASPDGKTLAVPGKGTWSVDASGAITFTPVPGFSGTPAPITYAVSDTNATTATATLTVTIGEPPAATTDSATTLQNTPVGLDPLGNDAAGDNGTGAAGTLDPASVTITTAGATDGGKKLVLDGKGTFVVDPATGRVTFTPEPAFTGDVPAVTYTVTDSFGNTATAEIRVSVTPVIPAAADDATTGQYGSPVTIDILGNDRPGDDSTTLVPSTLVFTDPAATEGGKVLVVPGEGTWRINADGTVTFTPADGFSGVTSPVIYRIADTNGQVTTASITVTVAGGPAASDDQVKGKGSTITVPVLSNDHAGDGCTLDPSTVVLLGTDGNPVDAARSLVVDGEGTWTVNADGTLTFVAEDGFSGWTSRVTYRVSDSCSHSAQAVARVWVPQSSGDSLAYTGAAVGGVVGVSILLLAGGGLLLAVRGRRRGRRFA